MEGRYCDAVKMMTTDREIEIIRQMFDTYVEYVASSYMCGEVPSSVLIIHSSGTKENDWLASVRFKNSLTISVFRCEVWLDDIVRLCRRCKIWLITEPILKVVVLYFMLHPLLQTQNINFKQSATIGYESMLAGAGEMTYRFIKNHFQFDDPVEQLPVLELLNYHNILFTNLPYGPDKENIKESMDSAWRQYKEAMLSHHPAAYRKSTHFKASCNIVDEHGYIRLAKRPTAKLDQIRAESVEDVLKLKGDYRKKDKRAFSTKPKRHKVEKMENVPVDSQGFHRMRRQSKDEHELAQDISEVINNGKEK